MEKYICANCGAVIEGEEAMITAQDGKTFCNEECAEDMGYMHYRGKNGVTALHISTFHEQMDMVVYCVEHGSDVNCIAGVNRVTPISIMFVPISSKLTGLDGTPFVHHKAAVKEIRRYLMSCGARDSFRFGY